MFETARAACGASAVDRCEISQVHGPGVASDLLRGGLGGPGLGLDVLEDCAPSAALLLLVGHVFPDSEACFVFHFSPHGCVSRVSCFGWTEGETPLGAELLCEWLRQECSLSTDTLPPSYPERSKAAQDRSWT